MNIDFFLEEESFEKLVLSFIELEVKKSDLRQKERNREEILLLNSILIKLSSKKEALKQLFSEIKYSIEINQNDRKCTERAAILMQEIIKRSQQILINASIEVLQEIITLISQKAFVAVCGNAFISLLNQICSTVQLRNKNKALQQILDLLFNPKLLVSTYRQQTRLCLYKLYIKILSMLEDGVIQLKETRRQKILIEKCINAGSGQKDPRNIGSVFEIYLKVLSLFTAQALKQFKSTMFQNLQSYYPIEFAGDQENETHQKINLKQISMMLDQCLTHHFFKEDAWQLFSTKTAAAPIGPFIPSFLLFLNKRKIDSLSQLMLVRCSNLLLRFTQQQYLQQQFSRDLYVGLLDFIFCRNDGTFSINGYTAVLSWLEKMVNKILEGPCKYSGTMMSIFRTLIKHNSFPRFRTLIDLFRNYSLRRVINSLENSQELIPKLGLTIVALSQNSFVSTELQEIVSLIILKMGKLYQEVNDQIKMLLLKILLEAYRGFPGTRLMVRNTNDCLILKDCLSRAKWAFTHPLDETRNYITKSFIQFTSTIYLNKLQEILSQVEGDSIELQSYLMCRLFQAVEQSSNDQDLKKSIIQRFDFVLKKIRNKQQIDQLQGSFKSINASSCIEMLSMINWSTVKQIADLFISMLIGLKMFFRKDLIEKEIPQNSSFSSKIKKYFYYSSTGNNNLQEIWSVLSDSCQTIKFPSLSNLSEIKVQTFKFEKKYAYGYEPTFIHWLWLNLGAIKSEKLREEQAISIIQFLPNKILLKDSQQILSLLIKHQKQGSQLLKIVQHLEISSLEKTGIIQYCLSYIEQLNQTNATEKNSCILAVLIDIVQREKQGRVKLSLQKQINKLRKLLLNRKRPIRQGVRKLIMMIQQ